MQKSSEKLAYAIAAIVIGVLLIVFKADIIGITMTVFGVCLIALAVIDFIHSDVIPGVIKAVAGVVIIVFGWTLVSAALYIMAALLLIFGIAEMYLTFKNKSAYLDRSAFILRIAECAVYVLIGLCLMFNQGGTIAWVFILSGVFLIVNGVIALIQFLQLSSKSKK